MTSIHMDAQALNGTGASLNQAPPPNIKYDDAERVRQRLEGLRKHHNETTDIYNRTQPIINEQIHDETMKYLKSGQVNGTNKTKSQKPRAPKRQRSTTTNNNNNNVITNNNIGGTSSGSSTITNNIPALAQTNPLIATTNGLPPQPQIQQAPPLPQQPSSQAMVQQQGPWPPRNNQPPQQQPMQHIQQQQHHPQQHQMQHAQQPLFKYQTANGLYQQQQTMQTPHQQYQAQQTPQVYTQQQQPIHPQQQQQTTISHLIHPQQQQIDQGHFLTQHPGQQQLQQQQQQQFPQQHPHSHHNGTTTNPNHLHLNHLHHHHHHQTLMSLPNDLDLTLQAGLECDIESLIKHEMSVEGQLDFNHDLLRKLDNHYQPHHQ